MALPCSTPPDTVSFLGGGVGVGSGFGGGGGGGGGSSPFDTPPGTPPITPDGTPPGTPCEETATTGLDATVVGSGIFSGGLVGGVKVVGAGMFLTTTCCAGAGGGADGGGGGAIMAATSNASASPGFVYTIAPTIVKSNPTAYIPPVTAIYTPVLVFS